MANIVLSPVEGRFSIPNSLGDAKEFIKSNFKNPRFGLDQFSNCVIFKRSDVENFCTSTLADKIFFSKVNLPNKAGQGNEATLAGVEFSGVNLMTDTENIVLISNGALNPRRAGLMKAGDIQKGEELHAGGQVHSSIQMPEISAESFASLLKRLQNFDNEDNANYYLSITFAKKDFTDFWKQEFEYIAFYPIMAKFDISIKTQDHGGTLLTDNYSALGETLLAVAVDDQGNVIPEVPGVISPNAWPPRYIPFT